MSQNEMRVAGWKEWIALPDLGVDWIKAKLDTGARSSSLHAYAVSAFERDGRTWASFEIHPWQRSDSDPVRAELPIIGRRVVRSSTGHEEERIVVETTVRFGDIDVTAELTLANRDPMGVRMLIGRQALRHRILVDAARMYAFRRPPPDVLARNRATVA